MFDAEDQLYVSKGFNGKDVTVPVAVDRETDPYLKLTTAEAIRDYYDTHGYVVIRDVLPADCCIQAMQSFKAEVKGYRGHLYRQPSGGKAETHRLTPAGFMQNSILNVHDLPTRLFGSFRRDSLAILTHSSMQKVLQILLGSPGMLVQSMYFEGNPNTWPHQDTYYLDSEKIGSMVAAWVAAEDISPGAGRFYVCPGSHKIDIKKNGGDFDVAFNHERYKNLTASIIENHGLKLHAPALNRGDVLFWNSRTIHGSLPTSQAQNSRSSFTAHYIPDGHRFLQFQSRIKTFQSQIVNDMRVNHPKDQDRLKNRVVMGLETAFPGPYEALKKAAIKIVTH